MPPLIKIVANYETKHNKSCNLLFQTITTDLPSKHVTLKLNREVIQHIHKGLISLKCLICVIIHKTKFSNNNSPSQQKHFANF